MVYQHNLLLNVDNAKVINLRKKRPTFTPLYINSTAVKSLQHWKFLGNSSLVKKPNQHLFEEAREAASESISFHQLRQRLSRVTLWHENSSASDKQGLRRVVRSSERTIRVMLPYIEGLAKQLSSSRAKNIIRHTSHSIHGPFSLVPSGRQYRSLKCSLMLFCGSFFPTAIRLLYCTETVAIL